MSREFQQASSLLSIVKHSNHKDCAHLFRNLSEKGTEVFCELLYFIVNGYLELKTSSHVKIKSKIKKCIKEIKTLITPPQRYKDVVEKKNFAKKKNYQRFNGHRNRGGTRNKMFIVR